jgi:hypothetical protein
MKEFSNKYLLYFYENRDKNIKFDFIKEERKKIKNKLKEIDYKIEHYTIPENKINKLVNTEWVYSEVINNLQTLDINYKITWNYKTTHNIYLKCSKEKYNSFSKRINILLNVINYLYDKKTYEENNSINMYLVLTPLEKNFDIDSIIGPKNINSGYTDFNKNEIFIWREEEFEKVIFHELIHYMDLDNRHIKFNDNVLIHNVNDFKSYFEAFTDFWGIIYHLIYVSLVTERSINSLLQIEFKFMENQANLINNFFKLNNWEHKKEINQNTPAFSYFIIKYMIFEKVINSNNITLLDDPQKLILNILSNGFKTNKFIILSPRMTLIQL